MAGGILPARLRIEACVQENQVHEQGPERFETTRWSVVLAAVETGSYPARAALEHLCRCYWYPIYAFLRRRGYDSHQAEDLTQSFFGFLLERRALASVDPQKGRFRSFLLAALTNFLNNEFDKARAAKRGGRHTIVSWDEIAPEERYLLEPAEPFAPDRLFERRWAFTLVERALARLREEQDQAGRSVVFRQLEPWLTSEVEAGQYSILAARLGLNAGATKVALHRLRRRFGELLRREVAHTVSQPDEIEPELRHLLAAIADGTAPAQTHASNPP
jgi:RNA polymerase sigma factor (sigma-70 family)